ncbi:hypothetical protein B0H11DRAFT_2211820 [Mycena galericulata]|nr:hypothetical protein B0H11DRAFT_2211820 [Mycena galericulata]
MPANYGLENLAIPVTQAALDELRGLIDTPREDAFRWVSDEFDEVATAVYIRIGSPKLDSLRHCLVGLIGRRANRGTRNPPWVGELRIRGVWGGRGPRSLTPSHIAWDRKYGLKDGKWAKKMPRGGKLNIFGVKIGPT